MNILSAATIRYVFLLAGFVASVNGQACSICGEGLRVGSPGSILFALPAGQLAVSCGEAETAGQLGLLSDGECSSLPGLIGAVCDCVQIGSSTFAPVFVPPTSIAPGTAAPLIGSPASAAPVAVMTAAPGFVNPCSVCGNGARVGLPDGVVAFPGEPAVSCGQLQTIGQLGLISREKCNVLPELIEFICDCIQVDFVTLAPLAPATTAPIGPPITPTVAAPSPAINPIPVAPPCSVCGKGSVVGYPDGVFVYPGQPAVPCREAEYAGLQGLIPQEACVLLPELIEFVCDCIQVGTPTFPPFAPALEVIPMPSVTIAPIDSPVEAPAVVAPPPAVPPIGSLPTDHEPCSVCGESLVVGFPNGIFTFPGQASVSCAVVESVGQEGLISKEACALLPNLLEVVCGCRPDNPALVPSAPIAVPPTTPPPEPPFITPTAVVPSAAAPPVGFAPTANEPVCSVCGEGSVVGFPDGIFSFPGQPSVPCGVLESIGQSGYIPLTLCDTFPALIDSVCECEPAPRGPNLAPAIAPGFVPSAPIVVPSTAPPKPPFVSPTTPPVDILPSTLSPVAAPTSREAPTISSPTTGGILPPYLAPRNTFRCGTTEFDARGNCKNTCAGSADCAADEYCWGTFINYCHIKPLGHPICDNDNSIYEQNIRRCGFEEVDARDYCGKECSSSADCPGEAEFCFPVIRNFCECFAMDDDAAAYFANAKEVINPYFLQATDSPVAAPVFVNPCSVCGDGARVGFPDAEVTLPGKATIVSCGQLQTMGQLGLISRDDCSQLPTAIEFICNCTI